MKRALITGIAGQEGCSYLAKLLLDKGYKVYGFHRRSSTANLWQLEYLKIKDKVEILAGDLGDLSSIERAVKKSEPDDYVITTGEMHTVREFVELVFKEVGIDTIWKGEGIEEQGVDSKTGKVLVKVNPEYFRPADVELLIGNAIKAREKLNWKPKVNFKGLVGIMMNKVDFDQRSIWDSKNKV